jgi:hypothetical protein
MKKVLFIDGTFGIITRKTWFKSHQDFLSLNAPSLSYYVGDSLFDHCKGTEGRVDELLGSLEFKIVK